MESSEGDVVVQTQFETELEIFRTEEETAQQYFFCYLAVRSLAKNPAVLAAMNTAPLFWITTHHAMLLSAIVALGRIFDQDSKHNINKLMATAGNLALFSKAALAARRVSGGLTKSEAANYVADKHELTAGDFRALRKEIVAWRRIYEDRYRGIRHKIFAHKGVSNVQEANELLAKTSVDELKALFAFLSALYSALRELFHNGRKPSLSIGEFVLPPDPPVPHRDELPGEIVYREGHAALMSMLPDQKPM
jgi:AbiU2